MRDLIKITLGTVQRVSGRTLEEEEANPAVLQTQQDAFSPQEPELPAEIVSSIEQSTFVQGNHALRSNWQNFFWVPPKTAKASQPENVVPIWCPFCALRTKQRYASASAFSLQVCFSKSSCASRLNASAATVLSRRGVVIPHVQREQHQPLKSSPSIEMRCLFMCVYLLFYWNCDPTLLLMGYHAVAVNSCG
jgi:hypothetical protein